MKKYGKEIFCGKEGEKLFLVTTRDVATSRVSFGFYTLNRNGEMSDVITIKRSDILRKPAPLDVLLDLDLFLSAEDIDDILDMMRVQLENPELLEVCEKATISDIYNAVVEFIHETKSSKSSGSSVFVDGGNGYIETKEFDVFVRNNKDDFQLSRVEVLNRLKIMGVLKPGRTRPYDTLKKIDGKPRRFYKFEMPNELVDGTEEMEGC